MTTCTMALATTSPTNTLFISCFTMALIVYFLIKTFKPNHKLHLPPPPPPSPPSLPLIGHLHLLGPVIPRSFQSLARHYGPIMQLRLGASTCVVVSSAAVAKEVFKTQEFNFSSRPEFGSSEHFIYRGSRFVLAQYGDYWRFMKKLCMTRLLAVPQLDKFMDVREEEVKKLVESLMEAAKEGRSCDMSGKLTTQTNNIICRMAMSTRCSGNEDDAREIKELVHTCLMLSGRLSVGDVLGPLRMLDFSGTGKKLEAALWSFDRIMERIIKEHEEKHIAGGGSGDVDNNGDQRKDLMDILLETFKDPTAEIKLTRKDIKSFLLDIFMAGTHTSSEATQWAMAELMNRPESFHKLRHEILSVVGSKRLVNESDVQNLPYLRAVIRETLRLHPSAPLIIRECGEDCMGSLVKAKTRVLVNVYGIMRDPDSWSNAEEFIPERFLENSGEKIGEHQMEYKGQNFRYLPFGSGRRGCPGASLAMLMIQATVGSLVQCFDWKLKGEDQKVDLSQGPGFASEMATPLVCYPTIHINPLSQSLRATSSSLLV